MRSKRRTIAEWSVRADRSLSRLARAARGMPALGRMAPSRRPWNVEVRVVGAPEMRRLNRAFRGKGYATDVLSFPAPEPFRSLGWLGELVVCAPTLEAQAAELGHAAEWELEVLLAHGLLHLLGLDHERGAREAATMARWEQRLLRRGGPGLIARSG